MTENEYIKLSVVKETGNRVQVALGYTNYLNNKDLVTSEWFSYE